MKKNNKGFTLAELLIVVAVIAVLVAVAIPTFGSQLEKARQATDVANLRDAYAIAKVAILNQEDGEWKTLFTTLSTNSKTEAYCNPDTGKISRDDNEQVTGKATTGSAIESVYSGLPSGIIYNGCPATTSKYIVVKFKKDTTTNAWSVEHVTFAAALD